MKIHHLLGGFELELHAFKFQDIGC